HSTLSLCKAGCRAPKYMLSSIAISDHVVGTCNSLQSNIHLLYDGPCRATLTGHLNLIAKERKDEHQAFLAAGIICPHFAGHNCLSVHDISCLYAAGSRRSTFIVGWT